MGAMSYPCHITPSRTDLCRILILRRVAILVSEYDYTSTEPALGVRPYAREI